MGRIAALLLILLTLSGCAMAADSDFPLGVYWPWERVCANAQRLNMDKWAYVDSRLDDMQAHHMDSVWVVNLNIADLGPLAKKLEARKMTLVPALGELHYNIEWRRNNWEYLEKESKRALQAAGESPAVIAWALCDEPRKNIVGEMEQFRQKFIEWGAKQRPVTVTMWPDSPTYARETKFPFVCTDIYPFFADGNPNGPNPANVSKRWYRTQVEMTAREAKETGKTPWIMPQAFCDVWGTWKYDAKGDMVILPGGVLHWRAPTAAETRWQVWAAVGAGAQGIYWYVYEPCVKDNADKPAYTGAAFPATLVEKQERALHATGGLVRRDGSATPQYEAAAEAHEAVAKLLPLLKGCVPVDIWPVQVSAPGWVGMLQNPASKRTFVAVVNDDCEKAQELTLTTANPKLRDLRTRKLLKVQDGKAVVRLEAGEGTLLEVAE
ncbi:MAG: hypothetical protein ACYC63_14540 [Armatimonadota bacterium]